ncbi:MAG: sugar ABC transporter permease [Actinomycetales bacterium]|nr:MAG: sugar ABC transporter permease [Actinomycetales bacterium]
MSTNTTQTGIPVPVTNNSRNSRFHRSATKARPVVKVVVWAMVAIWTLPTVGLLVTSFRPTEAQFNGWWNVLANPTQLTIQNYQDALTTGSNPMGGAFINSLSVAIPATIIPILIAAFAAYAFTFMEFKGKNFFFMLIVALLVIPNQSAFVPLFRLFKIFDINGTFLAAWLIHTGFGMPLAVYILRNYMGTLPRAVIESAKIDGASHFTTFWRLIIPMSYPALASYAIFQFLWVWNDLFVALIFLQGEPVMTVALKALMGQQGQGYALLTAGTFLTMLLPLVVFVSLQRYFIRGMTSGAVKG